MTARTALAPVPAAGGWGPVLADPLLPAVAALLALALPTLWSLARDVWPGDDQGHAPVLLAAAMWLAWRRRAAVRAMPARPALSTAWMCLAFAAALHGFGHALGVFQAQALAPVLGSAGLLLLWRGPAALRLLAVPLAVAVLCVPWPGIVVQTLTLPMKAAVSAAAEGLLALLDYPVARNGVVLAIDGFHLLVADACAGLASLFTLEAMGLVLLELRPDRPARHRAILALLIVPIAFAANIVRVVALALITVHFGDAAGRGFAHHAAGLVLFAVAAAMMIATDGALARTLAAFGRRAQARRAATGWLGR